MGAVFCVFFIFLSIPFYSYGQTLSLFTEKDLSTKTQVALSVQQHLVLADTNGVFTLQDVIANKPLFTHNHTQLIGFSPKVKVWWLHFSLKNTNTINETTFYFPTSDNNWAATEFYVSQIDSTLPYPHISWQLQKGGWLIPDSLCQTDRIAETLALTLEAGETKEIYIKKSISYVLPIQERGIRQNVGGKPFHDLLYNDVLWTFMIEAIFLGIVFMMTFYNFTLFIEMKEWSYFWYVLLILSFGLSFSEEVLYEIVADGGLFYYKFLDILNASAILFSILFVTTLLQTHKNYPTWFWSLLFTTIVPMITVVLVIGFDFISPVFRQNFLEMAFIPNTLLHIFLLFGVGIRGSQRQDQKATLFLAAGALLLFSLVVWNIHLLIVGEVLTTSLYGFVMYFSPKASFLVMGLLFSRHLTIRINALRKALLQEQLFREVDKKRIIEKQNDILEQLVQARTAEIEQQKEEIYTQNDALAQQNKKITKQHDDITASINAALRIQKAMLPRHHEIVKILPEHFILFRPRDIVSGDFYYFHSYQTPHDPANLVYDNVQNNFDNSFNQTTTYTILAAIDCTGHGVPGAFMSMVGNELLNELVQKQNLVEADQILNALNAGVKRALQQEETENRDGMDIALCVIKQIGQFQPQVFVEYAGANNPLYYVIPTPENNEATNQFYEIKADKMPIGGVQHTNKPFTKHTIQITDTYQTFLPLATEKIATTHTTFYLLSDGFQDQFGGEEGKKFMVKKLKILLASIAHLPMPEQKQTLENTLDLWKKHHDQVDDILVIGFKVYGEVESTF